MKLWYLSIFKCIYFTLYSRKIRYDQYKIAGERHMHKLAFNMFVHGKRIYSFQVKLALQKLMENYKGCTPSET